jgi:hypothetical protein
MWTCTDKVTGADSSAEWRMQLAPSTSAPRERPAASGAAAMVLPQ